MPMPRRSSLLVPRTPARVASGRNVGTASVPRPVASGSAMRSSVSTKTSSLGTDASRHRAHAPGVGDKALQASPVGAVHPASRVAAQRSADGKLTTAWRARRPRRRRVAASGSWRSSGGDELEQQRDIGLVGRRSRRRGRPQSNVVWLSDQRQERVDQLERPIGPRRRRRTWRQPMPIHGRASGLSPQPRSSTSRRDSGHCPDPRVEPVEVRQPLRGSTRGVRMASAQAARNDGVARSPRPMPPPGSSSPGQPRNAPTAWCSRRFTRFTASSAFRDRGSSSAASRSSERGIDVAIARRAAHALDDLGRSSRPSAASTRAYASRFGQPVPLRRAAPGRRAPAHRPRGADGRRPRRRRWPPARRSRSADDKRALAAHLALRLQLGDAAPTAVRAGSARAAS